MKNWIIVALVFGVSISLLVKTTNAQIAAEPKQLLDAAIAHAKTRSLFRTRPDWDKATAEIYAAAREAKTVEELTPALKLLLSKLDDSHGKFIYNGKVIAYYFGEPTENQKKIDTSIWSKIQSPSFPLRSELLNGRIGYLRIPGLPTGDNLAMSTEIRQAVCSLAMRGAKHWIVDLRYNGGGNMYPMMEGIAPLIGDGTIGLVADRDGQRISTWTIKDSDFYYDEYRAVDLGTSCISKTDLRVAVLLSQYTASSGEAVAVAFKGRPNTRFFGLDTAGLITVTDWTDLGGLTASLSIGYYADRNGVVYRNFVAPDEKFETKIDEPLATDTTIKAAAKWLRK